MSEIKLGFGFQYLALKPCNQLVGSCWMQGSGLGFNVKIGVSIFKS